MGTLIQFQQPRPARLGAEWRPQRVAVLPFPIPLHSTFAQDVRSGLARSCAGSSSVFPLRFGRDVDGSETCRLANDLVIGRDAEGGLWIGDCRSGFVDHGPFKSVSEICTMIAWLGG